ncbi:MAG TPA: DNA-binding response regulator [Deltaproteobacteria bacterium]|nr:MAG: DNA-binding response regulator [Deltaproteobacteria bacterium GWA2_55_82]OGQ62425.1 MAG: DNA-binding response regulator [Deltaproteobacteria bacterium RIFCSPLOWO2_02_FULL_55_12]OIJ73339.1 MAG: DNA-binding response regulator [Deltaproteobacteria bacterium GWC2_55_46]HBG45387.1 DNA-binding response regulator [Deltaproteobacteria bacterium]HCY10218.1 DNA-binding response regulator [Deltaproteobacteria bacterium]
MQKANQSRILVVDDEHDILNLLEYNLKKAGFQVLLARDGPEAIESARANMPELVLLDIMLPDMEGTEVLKRLKSNDTTRSIPVIMLTAKGEEIDKIIGFELGAEDYITKPFSPRELILRVKAVLKRTSERPQDEEGNRLISFKDISIDLSRHKVHSGGKLIELSSTEFNLLRELMQARGRVLSRDAILDRAWGQDCYVIPRTVDTHVRRLRSKLGKAGDYIETVRGVGYRFREE